VINLDCHALKENREGHKQISQQINQKVSG